MINPHERIEAQAWSWLLSLPRLDWKMHDFDLIDQQIKLEICPGKLGANQGAPYVKVSYIHPDLPQEILTDGGNNLAHACGHLYTKMLDKHLNVDPLPAEVALAF